MNRQHARPNASEQPWQDGCYSQRGPCSTKYSHSPILLSLTQTPEGLHHTSYGLNQWAPETWVRRTSHLIGTLTTAAGQPNRHIRICMPIGSHAWRYNLSHISSACHMFPLVFDTASHHQKQTFQFHQHRRLHQVLRTQRSHPLIIRSCASPINIIKSCVG